MSDRAKATRARVSGPLGACADGFRTGVGLHAELGGQLQLTTHVSRSLVDRGLDGHDLTSVVVEEFLQARRAAGYRQWLSRRGMAPLLDYLRGVVLAPAWPPVVVNSAVDVALGAI